MIAPEQIEQLYRQRVAERGPLLNRWMQVARQYDGDVVVPLPELDKDEKSMAVNLLGPGLDQLAMRIASTMPDIVCDSLRPGIQKWDNLAADKRRALLSYWDMNRMDMILRRRARYLLGYACSPVSISFAAMNPLDKRKIHIEKPIKALGDHEVEMRLHHEVRTNLKVVIKSSNPLPEPVAAPAPAGPVTEKRGKRVAATAEAAAPAAEAKPERKAKGAKAEKA